MKRSSVVVHVLTSTNKTPGERFLGRDSVLVDVRYYCCICCTCCIYDVGHMRCCVYIECVDVVYALLCTRWCG